MRVLYLIEIFPEISETFILDEMLEVKKQNIPVKIVSCSYSKDKESHADAIDLLDDTTYIKDLGLKQKYLATLFFFFRHPWRLLKFIKYLYGVEKYVRDTRNRLIEVCCLCALVKKWKIDHIHAHFANIATSYAMWIHMLNDVPFTFTTHGYDVFYARAKDMTLKTRLAKKHITISNFNRKFLLDAEKLPASKLQTNYIGIDLDKFEYQPFRVDSKLLINVGRLETVKGHQYLIQACKILKDQGLDFECRIIGSGKEEEILSALIRDLGLENICFLEGAKARTDVLEYYQQARMFVLSSVSEGLPTVVKESLACGIPTIATNVRGVPEMIEDGQTGALVPAESAGHLAEKILELWHREDVLGEYNKNGRRRVEEQFQLQKQVRGLIDIWVG